MIDHATQSRRETLYLSLVSLFTVIAIISNLVTIKFIPLPLFTDLAIPCGLIIYPFTFFIGDLVTELFGEKKAKLMVYMGLGGCLVAQAIIYMAINLSPHDSWFSPELPVGYSDAASYEHAFQSVFNMSGIALISSMIAYAIAQMLDIRIFTFLKELTKEKHLWFRNGGSTLISQLVDTLIFNTLFLYCGLKLDLNLVVHISLICYLYKAFFTFSNVPIFYAAVFLSKKFLRGSEEREALPEYELASSF